MAKKEKPALLPDEQADRDWLAAEIQRELDRRNRSGKVTVYLSNNRWICKVGNQRLGQVNKAAVRSRTYDVQKGLFRRKTTVRFYFEKPPHGTFFDLVDLWQSVSQTLTFRLMRGEAEGKAPSTWAYQQCVGVDGEPGLVDEWMQSRYEYRLKKQKEAEKEKAKAEKAAKPKQRTRKKRVRTKKQDKPEKPEWQPWNVSANIIATLSYQVTNRYATWYATKRFEAGPPWRTAKSFSLPANCVKLDTAKGFKYVKEGEDRKAKPQKVNGSNGQKKKTKRTDKVFATLSIFGMVETKDANGRIRKARAEQPTFRVYPRGRNDWQKVRRLWHPDLSQRYTYHAANVTYDQDLRRWVLSVTLAMPEPEEATGSKIVAIRRGSFRWLRAMDLDGTYHTLYDQGDPWQLIHLKNEFHSRRKRKDKHFYYQGKGARGHGRARFFRIKNQLSDAEHRAVQGWLQKSNAYNAKKLADDGVREVILEKFDESKAPVHPNKYVQTLNRKFPLATLRDSFVSAIEKQGIKVTVVAQDYNDKSCPVCASPTEDLDGRRRKCTVCGYAAWSDTIACYHLFAKAGYHMDAVAKAEREEEVSAAFKAAAKGDASQVEAIQ